MNQAPFLSGKLLLAMPGMADPRFERAVIAICLHDEHGAVGVGIGQKRSGMRFRTLLEQLGIEPDWGGEDTIQVNAMTGPLCAMTGTIDVLRAIAEGRGPSQWIVALGYAGWAGGQLEQEMTRHGWFTAEGDPALLWDTPADERWQAAFRSEGVDPRLLSSQTGAA